MVVVAQRWSLAMLVLASLLSSSASTLASPSTSLLASHDTKIARADRLQHTHLHVAASKSKFQLTLPSLLASPDAHPRTRAIIAKADGVRNDMMAFLRGFSSKYAGLKIVGQPTFEPGFVACMGSAAFIAAGLSLKCAPRVVAGLITALIVSAPVQILDMAIMENASGKRSMADALSAGMKRLTSDPKAFLSSQENALVYCLFGATYATANICRAMSVPTAGTLLATTIANMGSCFYKDSELARICGQGPRREFPKLGFANLAARDMLSMGSTFTLPPVLSGLMKSMGMPSSIANNIAQTSCPVLGQVFQAPFHLMALSYYNEPDFDISQRFEYVKKLYKPTLFARMARALPCYGAGGVLNTNLQSLMVGMFPHM